MATYQEALNALNSAQRKAVETIDGPVLVIAGPGTGKTQLLTTRIAHILSQTDTLPQNILCLTFTDSAAQTMQERLSGMIGQGAYDVTISTYHAFGSDIIRRFPDYFPEQAEQKPADDLTIDRIFRQIVQSLPYSNPLKYSEAYLGDIKTLVSDAKRALLTPAGLREVANQNLSFIKRANPVIRRHLDGIARIDKKSIPQFSKLHGELAQRETKSDASISGQFIKELKEAVEAAEESGKTNTLTAWKNAWLAKDDQSQFIADGTRANQKLIAAAEVYEQYLLELKARGLFDYDDMILRAVHTLETNQDLKFTLQEQYQYILLDEFQDTNEAQLRLVELLTDNPVNEGRPNILAVGDDDQAIYAFQGADYSHMLQFNKMYRDVTAIPLTENYRSHSDILHTARGIAEQIEERLHHHFPQIEKTLTARAKNLPEHAVAERREARSDIMQYAWATKRIQQLLEQGIEPEEIAVLAPKHRLIEPLVPFLTQENVPVRYDKRENVLDDPALNQLLRMAELTLALKKGDHPAANALWPQVLSFGFWELPTSTIWRFSWQTTDHRQDWTGELLGDEQLKPVALFFIRLSQIAGTETLETMFDYLIGTYPLDLNEPGLTTYQSPYYEHYFGELTEVVSTAEEEPETGKFNADFWTLLTNLIVLRSRLREYHGDGEERLTLEHFVEFVRSHRDAEIKILNTSPYASGTKAVQLMTAYKAKGMEFKAVFILAANDEAWGGKARSTGARISLPPNLQYIRYAGATEDERLRLFYVAITRAKHQLYLVNFAQDYAGKNMTRLKYLNETPDEQGIVTSPLLPESRQQVLPAEDGVAEPTTELAAYWQQRHEAALKSTDMQALLQDRLKTFRLSATHISDFVDFVHCGPQSFFLLTILRFPQAPRPELQYGNAMHETLEWVHISAKQNDGGIPKADAVHKTFAQRLEAKRLSAHDHKLFLERGKEALSAYLKQRAHTISPDNIVEHNFRYEGVLIGPAHLSGKIDKLIINKQAKEIVIVDYKTGRSHHKWTREYNLHKNRQQLYFYKTLVEGSHTFAGYKVTGAYLEFVEPDENGKIQELHLPLDNNEYQQTRELAQTVWQRIMNLSLPDTSRYTQDLKGIEQFESDLLNSDENQLQ
jgi:DNA helicase-2/ATP-dependent DNA helicase PcrA